MRVLLEVADLQSGRDGAGEDGAQGVDEPVGRSRRLLDFAFVDDRLVLDKGLGTKVRAVQAERVGGLGIEHFQERVGFVHHQRAARLQGLCHVAEELADVRHPVQYADGDQRQVEATLQLKRQVVNVRLDEFGITG